MSDFNIICDSSSVEKFIKYFKLEEFRMYNYIDNYYIERISVFNDGRNLIELKFTDKPTLIKRVNNRDYVSLYVDFITDLGIVIEIYEKFINTNYFDNILLKYYKYLNSKYINRISSQGNIVDLHIINDKLDYYFKVQPTYIIS